MRIKENHFTDGSLEQVTLPECDFFLHRQQNSNSTIVTMTSITMIPPAAPAPAITAVDTPSVFGGATSEDEKDLNYIELTGTCTSWLLIFQYHKHYKLNFVNYLLVVKY